MVYVIECLSLHSVIASGCVNGCAYVSSRFLWVPCVSLLISSAYVSVSMMCVSSDRRCSRTVDPDDFLQTYLWQLCEPRDVAKNYLTKNLLHQDLAVNLCQDVEK